MHSKNMSLWVVPALLLLYNLAANLSNDIYLPVMPSLTHVFQTREQLIQLTITVWYAGVALPQLFLGPLSDVYGRKYILLYGSGCFIGATLLCLFAPNIYIFLLARFLQGVGTCTLNISTYSISSDLFDYTARTRFISYVMIVTSLSPPFGPVLGSYLLVHFGWHVNFYVLLALLLICGIGLTLTYRETNPPQKKETVHFQKIFSTYWKLLSDKRILKNLIMYACLMGGIITYLTMASFIVINHFHIPTQYFGYVQTSIFLSYTIGALIISQVSKKYYRPLLISGFCLLILSGVLMIVQNFFYADNIFTALILPMMMYSLGYGLSASLLLTEIMSVPKTQRGAAAALLGTGMSAGGAMFGSIATFFYTGSLISMYSVLLFILVFSMLMYFSLDHSQS